MADSDWKERVGFNINFNPGEEDEEESSVEYRKKNININQKQRERVHRETSTEEILSKFDQYGSTPPRTRSKIKNRDWDRKQKMDGASKKVGGTSRLARARVNRRNTMDCALLNQMFIDDDETKKINDKRSAQLNRESEREIKMSLLSNNIQNPKSRHSFGPDERVNSVEVNPYLSTNINSITNTTLIESANRFMSVSSRPVGCRSSAPPSAFNLSLAIKVPEKKENESKLQNRQEFHETFSNLIKLGSVEKQEKNCKRTISREEHIWQTELKDLIWLELQAYHADRSLEQQDNYLLSARREVGDLLKEIMTFRFKPNYLREMSTVSDADSGVATDSANSTQDDNILNGQSTNTSSACHGCLSMYCEYCLKEQTRGLKQIEILLTRLEAAEALYPSTKSFGDYYPLYRSEKFVGRVKAMCLWYNITRHHRLKLIILGKLLSRLQGAHFQWPLMSVVTPIETMSSNSSLQENCDFGKDAVDSPSSSEPCDKNNKTTVKVQFDLDRPESDNPSDSTSSTESSKDPGYEDQKFVFSGVGEYGKLFSDINVYSVQTFADATYTNVTQSTSLYRKYIENVLKSRGLGKSLSFLHRLHNVVLRKAQITLINPKMEDIEGINDMEKLDDDIPYLEPDLDREEADELRRYGAWSPESLELGLPSYVPAFIFLSLIPLEVIHEFLRMRLETKPLKPNPLSLEQLMKELREGLTLALLHRDRFNNHISTALYDKPIEMERYNIILEAFDNTVRSVLELYLNYVEQWVLVAAPEGHQKSALDEEWMFTKLICPMIPGQHSIAAKKFCMIISNLLQNIGNTLITRSLELDSQTLSMKNTLTLGDSTKWQLLTICREMQSLFTVERDKAVKVMSFAKSLSRDIEQSDFHRDHCLDESGNASDDFICSEVKESVKMVKREALVVREKLTKTIERCQERCDIKHMSDMDEVDKISVSSRTREILHQGYKFGFEYHKDLARLFETKMEACKDVTSELNLSIGVVTFAKMWMKFVMERCERGRGLRPRWASQGFDFLIAACDPTNTLHLNDEQFTELSKMMDACISHVIGSISEPERVRASPRSRKTSPTPKRARTPTRPFANTLNVNQKNLLTQMSVKEEAVGLSPTCLQRTPELIRKQTSCDNSGNTLGVPKLSYSPVLRQIRIRDSINRLDMDLEHKLREKNLIGQVRTLNICDKVHIRSRSVTFRWHRGIKIGQGRFGKVYTAVNNSTGELMAMKEIPIQPGENRAIKRVAEELKIFEGISHKHLVKYYGVEIHREELLIFMELCSEGTLESLVELSGGLYEALARRFTAQLLSAAVELHKYGVVHRDIKTANIFLTNGGNCLKLGDFGSAVKIQANTTVPGELQGYVGTQAYMAPEVFTKTNSEGHGRAADIWSIGCVVIEMISGKRPWAQFDSNFQIMFKVGMGETPEIPESLSQEGHEFLEKCLQHDPKDRYTAAELLQHNFCKVGLEDDCPCTDQEKEIRRSFRKGTKT